MLLPKKAHKLRLVSSLFVIVGGKPCWFVGFVCCSLSLKLQQQHLHFFFWSAVPLISHLTALKGFGSWREKSGYRNGVSGGENW